MNTATDAMNAVSTQGKIPSRVLLVYPKIPDGTYWSYSHALRIIGKKTNLPPLGLLTVAAMLPDHVELRLADLNIGNLREEDILWADVAFISAMIVQKEGFEDVVARLGEAGVPVVAGGPYPSTSYANLAGVDHLIIGEAEPIMAEFWKAYERGEAKRAYACPVDEAKAQEYREYYGAEADVRMVNERPALSEVPVPRFDLLDLSAYRAMSVQTSRGCPVGCEFCDIWRRFGRKPRCKPVDMLLNELDALYKAGWNNAVFVVDDNFIGNTRLAKNLLKSIAAWQKERNYPFDFFTEATLTLADDDELLHLFGEAGFDMVFLGLETPASESLAETGKHINTRGDMVERVAKIQAAGIQVTAGFIIGFDNDPENIADRMIECIQNTGIPSAMVGILMPLPETDLHDRLAREGRLTEAAASGNNTHDFRCIFRTKRPENVVVDDYKRILNAIYPNDLKSFFQRCSTLRNRWQPRMIGGARLTWFSIRALLGCLVVFPWRSYRWYALRFLVGTLLKKPAFFATAVGLVIQGHHFRQITRHAFEVATYEIWFREKLESFSQTVHSLLESSGDLQTIPASRMERLWSMREEILAEASKRARKVSRDAREMALKRYDEFVGEMEAMCFYLRTANMVPVEA